MTDDEITALAAFCDRVAPEFDEAEREDMMAAATALRTLLARAQKAEETQERAARTALEAAADCCMPHCDDDSLDRQAKLECALAIRAIDPAQIVKGMKDE